MSGRAGSRIELRYADMPWGEELDEVVVRGRDDLIVHLEDLGQGVSVMVSDGPRRLHLLARLAPLPRQLWREELYDAWIERRWPCFRRVRLYLSEDNPGSPAP